MRSDRDELILDRIGLAKLRHCLALFVQKFCHLILEPNSVGHVSGVQHHTADVPVVTEIRDKGLEVSPLIQVIHHAEHDLVWLAVRARRLHQRPIIRMHKAGNPPTEDVALRSTEDASDGLADVPTSTSSEDKYEVCGRRDEAAEVRRLPSNCDNEGPCKQKRRKEPHNPKHDLDGDEVANVPVGGRGETPRRIE